MEEKVIIYDPGVDAYREVDIEKAEKFIKSAKEAEKRIAGLKVAGAKRK